MRDWNREVWLLLVIFLFSASSLACEWDYFIWIPRSPTADPLYRFLKDGKAGYIDRTGKVVIGPILPNFGGNSGAEFHNGLLEIGASDGVYVNKSGKKVIDLGLYRGWDFSEGLAAAVKEDNGEWGYIDTKGQWAIAPRFGWSATDYVSSFEGGFALIEVSGKYGYIDHTGEFVIPPHFLLGSSFNEGFAQVVLDGPCFYSDQTSPCSSPISLPRGTKTSQSLPPCKLAFIDTKGRVISEHRFDEAKPFSEGMAPVRIEKTWGFIDTKGSVVIPPQYARAEGFSDGLALVLVNEKYGYIDQHGSYVIEPQFRYAETFSEGYTVVGDGDSVFWYIDRSGKQAFHERFAAASPFFKGLAHVRLQSKTPRFAYIDHSGKSVFAYKPG